MRGGRLRVLAALALWGVALSGCGYSLAGRGAFLPSYVRTIGVPNFTNGTVVFNLETTLTQKVRSELIGRGKYQILPQASEVDALLVGEGEDEAQVVAEEEDRGGEERPEDGARIVNNRSMPDVNCQHIIAVALVDGTVSFEDSHSYERMADPKVRAAKERVELVADRGLMVPAAPRSGLVEVTLRDGRTVTTPVEDKQKHYFITVQLADMVYVGEYTPAFFGKPGDWVIGDPISVRLDGNNMYLQKPNGKELKSKIRKRIRAAEAPEAAANPQQKAHIAPIIPSGISCSS